jgi:hypothetical protein
LTQDFNEFAAVREDVLLHIMNLIEDSGASLASSSQTLYLASDRASPKQKSEAESRRGTESPQGKPQSSPAAIDEDVASNQVSADRQRLQSALRNRTQDGEKNAGKDD